MTYDGLCKCIHHVRYCVAACVADDSCQCMGMLVTVSIHAVFEVPQELIAVRNQIWSTWAQCSTDIKVLASSMARSLPHQWKLFCLAFALFLFCFYSTTPYSTSFTHIH